MELIWTMFKKTDSFKLWIFLEIAVGNNIKVTSKHYCKISKDNYHRFDNLKKPQGIPTRTFAAGLSTCNDFKMVAPSFVTVTPWPLPVDCKILSCKKKYCYSIQKNVIWQILLSRISKPDDYHILFVLLLQDFLLSLDHKIGAGCADVWKERTHHSLRTKSCFYKICYCNCSNERCLHAQ